jgi:transcriptional regulator with XRE-family HTH domain
MDLREVFAANLRRLRHAKGLSQDDLAYEAEISRSYLSQVEKGVFFASLKIIGRLAKALDVEPAELLKMPRNENVDVSDVRKAGFVRIQHWRNSPPVWRPRLPPTVQDCTLVCPYRSF